MPLVTSPSDIRGFSQANQPAVVPEGGLWYDTSVDTLFVSDGSTFNTIGASSFAGAAVVSQSVTIGNYTTPTSATVSSTGTGTPVVEPFTTGWTQTGTKIVVTGGQGVATNLRDNETDYIYKAFTNLNDSVFSIDFDFQINSRTLNNGSLFGLIAFSAANTNCCTTANSNDMIGVGAFHLTNTFLCIMTKDGTGSVITTEGTVAINIGTAYYGTLERLSTTTTRLRFWTSSTRLSGLVDTINGTVNSTTTGLSFAQVNSGQNGGGAGGLTFSVDNLSTTPSLAAANLFDNDTTSRWASTSSINPNCYVDQASSLNFAGAAFFYDNTNTTATSMLIQTSSDGSTWTTKRTITTSNLVSGYNFYRFNIATGVRYVRFYGNDSGAKVLSLYEIKIYQRTEAQIINDLGILEIDSTDSTLNAAGT